MRKLILLFLALGLPLGAALTSGTVQLYVATTGSDSNGGGFDLLNGGCGTNYGLQNSPQIAYTDLTIGASTSTYTSALHPVGASIVCNLIQVTATVSGSCNLGTFEVISQATLVATVNAALGTTGSVCDVNLGGWLATIGKALAVEAWAAEGPYDTINVKQPGTYTQTTPLAGQNGCFVNLIGFTTTPGDGANKCNAANSYACPLVTTATNSTDLVHSNCAYMYWDNFQFSNTAGTAGAGIQATGEYGSLSVVNSAFRGTFTYDINGDNAGSHYTFEPLFIQNTELTGSSNCVLNEITNPALGNIYIGPGTYVHGCTTYGVQGIGGSYVTANGAIFDSNGYGIYNAGGVLIENSVCSNSTHDCVNGAGSLAATNNIAYGNGGYAFNPEAGAVLIAYTCNAYGANVSGNVNTSGFFIPASALACDVSLSQSPFVGSGNFALNAYGKSVLTGLGYPGTTPGGSGAMTFGPLQPAAAASSGGPHAFVQ